MCVFVDLGIQHGVRMRRIIYSSVVCLVVQRFSTLSYKRRDFWGENLSTKCVFWFSIQLLSETFLILRRTERDMITGLRTRYPLILVRF